MRHTLAGAIGMAVIVVSAGVAQEYDAGPIKIESPWTRATASGAKVAAGYMKIENNGKEADCLIGGTVNVARKFEVHGRQCDEDARADQRPRTEAGSDR
jgi:copper(I)-binding protein